MSDLVSALASDTSTRLFAELAGWQQRLDQTWLLSALVQASGAEVRWPWVATHELSSRPDEETVEAAKASMRERWGV